MFNNRRDNCLTTNTASAKTVSSAETMPVMLPGEAAAHLNLLPEEFQE